MKANKAYVTLTLVLALSAHADAQSTSPASPATLDVLLSEVHLLRQAIERQTLVMAKSQVLAARLSVQEQRVVRARTLHESLESQIVRARVEKVQSRSAIERMEAALDDPARAAQRKEIEAEIKSAQNRIPSPEAAIGDLQARLRLALQTAEQERARLDDLESQLLREDFSDRERR